MRDVFLHHPEVKCLATSICWNGELNDAKISHGLWLSPTGQVQTIDGIIGSLKQVLMLAEQMFVRAVQVVTALEETAVKKGQELRASHEELQKVKEEIKRLRASAVAIDPRGDRGDPESPEHHP